LSPDDEHVARLTAQRRTRPLDVVGRQLVSQPTKPLAAVVPLHSGDWEDFVVSQDPGFIEVIRRSEARYKAEGGISLDEMRGKHGMEPRRRARRRRP
jgi:hypothetical protein